jgi:SNF2 family DNA or RNA helicase
LHLTLEKYQQQADDFLYDRERAALFASMGLGKSAATLAALNRQFQDGSIRSALIVAPLRVARLTWPNEIAKWDQFRWMKVESLRGQKPSGKADIYTINYEQLQNLPDLKFTDVVVFDELTRAKNPKSERINSLRPLLKHQRRWGLTGTPRPNSLLELFAQVRLLDDGKRLGPSFTHFRNTYFDKKDYMGYRWEPKEGAEKAVYEKIADLTLTLRAEDHLHIPETIVEDIEVPLPPHARKIYDQLERDLLAAIGDATVVAPNAGALSNKLLQVTGGNVYDEEKLTVHVHDAKINALLKLRKSLGKENVIIATNYIHERERVVAALGGTDASTFKGDIEDAWNSGKITDLVADSRSLAHGLNLQVGGSTVIWYSPTYSREVYDQFNARVARKGQGAQPRVYRIIASDTLDEAVIETLRLRGDSQGEMLVMLKNLQQMRA